MQWPSKCVRPSNLIMAISCYSDFSNSLLGAATGTGYWLKLQVGWARLGVREGDQPASQSPDATPPPPTPFFSPPHTFYKHTNMEQVDTDSFVCSFHWDPLHRAGSVEHRGKRKKENCEMKTWDLSLGSLILLPPCVTMARCLCLRSNEERAKEGR